MLSGATACVEFVLAMLRSHGWQSDMEEWCSTDDRGISG